MTCSNGTSRRGRARTALAAGAIALALGFSGCASLAPAPQSFDLRAAHVKARPFSARIFVATPSAIPPLDGDLIVVRAPDGALSRVPGARWADSLPALVRSRLGQTFENAGLARQVALSSEGADLSLAIEIRRFDIDAGTRMAQVELTARLVSRSGGRSRRGQGVFGGRAGRGYRGSRDRAGARRRLGSGPRADRGLDGLDGAIERASRQAFHKKTPGSLPSPSKGVLRTEPAHG